MLISTIDGTNDIVIILEYIIKNNIQYNINKDFSKAKYYTRGIVSFVYKISTAPPISS